MPSLLIRLFWRYSSLRFGKLSKAPAGIFSSLLLCNNKSHPYAIIIYHNYEYEETRCISFTRACERSASMRGALPGGFVMEGRANFQNVGASPYFTAPILLQYRYHHEFKACPSPVLLQHNPCRWTAPALPPGPPVPVIRLIFCWRTGLDWLTGSTRRIPCGRVCFFGRDGQRCSVMALG